MSAFIVSQEHIKRLAVYAASKGRYGRRVDPRYLKKSQGEALAEATVLAVANWYAEILYRENIRSVEHRYPDDDADNLPGPIHKPANIICTRTDEALQRHAPLPAVWILKMCNCLAYQSCEPDDWEETAAHELLESIKNAAVNELPGYDEAPWDYDEAQKAA